MRLIRIAAALAFVVPMDGACAADLSELLQAIHTQASSPVDYAIAKLRSKDLIIFDDAIHQAREPFDFYAALVRDPRFVRSGGHFVFLEKIPVNRQGALDKFFNSPKKQISLLYPAFDVELGIPYKSYFDLLSTIWDVNRALPVNQRIRVIGVEKPERWSEIRNYKEKIANDEWDGWGRDAFMYDAIASYIGRAGKKGILLTNTRHAYTGLKPAPGKFLMNAGTLLAQGLPERVFSIRINGPFVDVKGVLQLKPDQSRTKGGMEEVTYSIEYAAGGSWERAFVATGRKPFGIDLDETSFGDAPYIGNQGPLAAPGQVMADAYDGLIFLKPARDLTEAARVADFYTAPFKAEIVRRLPLHYTVADLKAEMAKEGVSSVKAWADKIGRGTPERPLAIAQALPPLAASEELTGDLKN